MKTEFVPTGIVAIIDGEFVKYYRLDVEQSNVEIVRMNSEKWHGRIGNKIEERSKR